MDRQSGGSPRSDHRIVWQLAWPIILSNLSVPMLGAVDTAVLGHLPGAEHMGAAAVGALIFSVIYAGMNFLRMGTTGFVAQACTSGGENEVALWLGRGLLVSALLGLTLWLVQVPLLDTALWITGPTGEVAGIAADYFGVRIWSAPMSLANFTILGWLLGMGRARSALFIQIAMNGMNMALDLLLVVVFDQGVSGVAAATLFSEVFAVVLGLMLARPTLQSLAGKTHQLFEKDPLRRMFSVNRDIFIRSMCLQAAFTAFTAAGTRQGTVILAANAVLTNFQMFTAYGLDGFANAAETLTGREVGRRDAEALRSVVRASTHWAFLFALGFTLVYALGAERLIFLLTDVAEVRQAARNYQWWAVTLPLVCVWCFLLDGIFTGATHTGAMRNSMLVSLLGFLGMIAWWVPMWGNHGLWAAFSAFMVLRGLTMLAAYPALMRKLESVREARIIA